MGKDKKVDVFVNIVSLLVDERTSKYMIKLKTVIDMTDRPIFKDFWIARQEVNARWGTEEKFGSRVFRSKIHEFTAGSIPELRNMVDAYVDDLKSQIQKRLLGFEAEYYTFQNVQLSYSNGCFGEEREEVEFEIKRD